MYVLVTGAAGFIGYHVCRRLLDSGSRVLGLDNLNDYYSVQLKRDRLDELKSSAAFGFRELDLEDISRVMGLFEEGSITHVIHLAAQVGVPYSLENPRTYVESNVLGFLSVLEACRHHPISHLIYASSSSVYGLNTQMPFSEEQTTDHPVSLYAATKKSNELMAHCYSTLFGIPCSGLRFFTVYGPWGRPDMAAFRFVKSILEDTPIEVYNHGKSRRSFTYVDDVVEGVFRLLNTIPQPDPNWRSDSPIPQTSSAPYRIYNIGNDETVELDRFIRVIEDAVGKRAIRRNLPLRDGDVPSTFADIAGLEEAVGYRPSTPIETGIRRFVDWYRTYYGVSN